MAKNERGLPSSFGLDVDSPADLGDYLEDEIPPFFTPKVNQNGEADVKSETQDNVVSISTNKEKVASTPSEVKKETRRKKREVEPPRKQVNMKADTLRKVDELLFEIRQKGVQKDAAASEMFDALISALYDSRHNIDYSNIPKRGQWGSETAEAFIDSLSLAFARAIASSQ